jgi:hypothetical protein
LESSIHHVVASRAIPVQKKIPYLQKYLSGEAKDCISSLFIFDTNDAYESAWAQLNKQYGSPFAISESFRKKLDHWPEIQGSDYRAIQKFADFISQCAVAKSQITTLSILDDGHKNRKMLHKLPRFIQNEWCKRVSESDNYPSFEQFSRLINKLVYRLNNPV